MSGHGKKNGSRPQRSDWIVTHHDGTKALIAAASICRDGHGGYAFTDDHGVVADFPPGTVLNVIRKDEPDPEPEAAEQAPLSPGAQALVDLQEATAKAEQARIRGARRNPGAGRVTGGA